MRVFFSKFYTDGERGERNERNTSDLRQELLPGGNISHVVQDGIMVERAVE